MCSSTPEARYPGGNGGMPAPRSLMRRIPWRCRRWPEPRPRWRPGVTGRRSSRRRSCRCSPCRGPGREPAASGHDLQAADRGAIARGADQLGDDRIAGDRRRVDGLRRQFRQPGLLLRRRRRVDARVVRRAELRRELTVVLARILARTRGDLGGEEIHDQTVFVGGPDGAVVTEEARPCALLAAEALRSVEQPGDEPLEADRDLEQPAAEFLHDAIDHAAADQRLADRGMGRPPWPVRQAGIGWPRPGSDWDS